MILCPLIIESVSMVSSRAVTKAIKASTLLALSTSSNTDIAWALLTGDETSTLAFSASIRVLSSLFSTPNWKR